jgi:hypothetical protein
MCGRLPAPWNYFRKECVQSLGAVSHDRSSREISHIKASLAGRDWTAERADEARQKAGKEGPPRRGPLRIPGSLLVRRMNLEGVLCRLNSHCCNIVCERPVSGDPHDRCDRGVSTPSVDDSSFRREREERQFGSLSIYLSTSNCARAAMKMQAKGRPTNPLSIASVLGRLCARPPLCSACDLKPLPPPSQYLKSM